MCEEHKRRRELHALPCPAAAGARACRWDSRALHGIGHFSERLVLVPQEPQQGECSSRARCRLGGEAEPTAARAQAPPSTHRSCQSDCLSATGMPVLNLTLTCRVPLCTPGVAVRCCTVAGTQQAPPLPHQAFEPPCPWEQRHGWWAPGRRKGTCRPSGKKTDSAQWPRGLRGDCRPETTGPGFSGRRNHSQESRQHGPVGVTPHPDPRSAASSPHARPRISLATGRPGAGPVAPLPRHCPTQPGEPAPAPPTSAHSTGTCTTPAV